MMDEKTVSVSCNYISEDKTDSLYPMYFGVSCAFVALRLLSEPDMHDAQWSEKRERMLRGSVHLLGLLVWKMQKGEPNSGMSELCYKLEKAKTEVAELKRRRREDAKANEKVVSIFAAQEQCWLGERKKLQLQIRALLNELRVREAKKEEFISNLNEEVKEKELLIQSRGKSLEEEERKRKELEEKLQNAESIAEELRVSAKREAQEHSSELRKHKTAFIELVSNQRQLEAEMGRALRQVEAAKQELDSVFKQKEESVLMVQKLSMEIVKIHKDLEQKDKMLSVMLRKCKLDTAEKQMLLKEVKISKLRRKQTELETERWRALCESRHKRHFSKSNLAKEANSRSDVFLGTKGVHPIEAGCSQNQRTGLQPADNKVNLRALIFEYLEAEHRKEQEAFTPQRNVSETSDSFHQYSPEGNEELMITSDAKHLEGWICSEINKYKILSEQRHHLEIDSFTEQMRLKDEKLEVFHWRLLSMELESKRLQSHMEGLVQNMSQLREENMKLEALLLDREAELKSLKKKFTLQLHPLHCQKANLNSSPKDLALCYKTISSEVKIIQKNPREKEEEPNSSLIMIPYEVETQNKMENPFDDQSKGISFTVQSCEKNIDAEKEIATNLGYVQEKCVDPEEAHIDEKLASVGHCLIKDTSIWKMDLHALGVSYKIKRLKQQLLMLEKLLGTQKSCEERGTNDQVKTQIKSFLLLMSLLNKQVSRYQSLQEKIDDLCRRMHKNNPGGSSEDSSNARNEEETRVLEHFLEETFQLQRYMVATGQKVIEIQSRFATWFVGGVEVLDGSTGFDMRRFADCFRTLFREVQQGLEVRIARIIGDLEGTLASEEIIQLRN